MAINSEIGVYNLALNAVGERANVSSPAENSRRAEVCRLWYDLVRDQVMEAAPWPEATTHSRLARKAEQTTFAWVQGDPSPGYQYSFVLPADCLRPQYLKDFAPFELTTENGVKLLQCNTAEPILRYTAAQNNVALWANNLLMAIVYGLAGHIAQPLSGKTRLTATLVDRANQLILAARVNSANQPNQHYEHIPDWIAARGYLNQTQSQFFYPVGGLLNVE